MLKITIQKSTKGWQAMFEGKTDMPQGVYLPLPFAPTADKEMIKADLRRRFDVGAFIVKGNQKGIDA